MRVLKVNPYPPGVLWLQGRLLADELALVPSRAFRRGFHDQLLVAKRSDCYREG